MSALVWSLSPSGKPINEVKANVELLNRKFQNQAQTNRILANQIQAVGNAVKNQAEPIHYTGGGTGFLIDTRGYVVTNAHVVDNARHIAVQGSDGKEFSATSVYADLDRDIAILKINDNAFKSPKTIPYSIKKT